MGRARFAFAPEHVALMGKVPDAEVARAAGCARLTVVNYRKREAVAAPPRVYRRKTGEIVPKAPYHRFLGLVEDTEIAAVFGVSRQAVGMTRKYRSILAPELPSMHAWQILFSILDSAEVGTTKVTIPRAVYDDIVAASVPKKVP